MNKWLGLVGLILMISSCGWFGGSKDTKTVELRQSFSASAGGGICGSKTIIGTHEPSFSKGGCGISNPVRIKSVAGISLSNSALVNCETARAFEAWVERSAKPSASIVNKQLSSVDIAASYSCRTRNHKKGAKLSEHAKGNAIDVSGFTFTDGTHWTLINDYYRQKRFFRKVHKEACKIFGTILGPGVPLHDDHFHFDVARYSMGSYCK